MADKETKTTKKPATKNAADTPAKEEKVDTNTTPAAPATDKLPSEAEAAAMPPAAPAAASPDSPAQNDTLISEPAADAAPAAASPDSPAAPEEPVVVSDSEVAAPASNGGEEKLAEEIEVLTGEIQALEAKIEQLTNGATSAPTEPAATGDVAPINAAQTPEQPKEIEDKKEEAPAPPEPMKTEETTTSEKDFVNKPEEAPKDVPTSATAKAKNPNKFSDISAKPKSNETPGDLNPSDEEKGQGETGGLAIIGEVIAVFGVIIFIILAISPFFKESVSAGTYEAVQQIGWLSAIGSLALGLILYMFVKGRILFKILIFILLLMAAVLFLAINENSLVEPIVGGLDSLIEFYR